MYVRRRISSFLIIVTMLIVLEFLIIFSASVDIMRQSGFGSISYVLILYVFLCYVGGMALYAAICMPLPYRDQEYHDSIDQFRKSNPEGYEEYSRTRANESLNREKRFLPSIAVSINLLVMTVLSSFLQDEDFITSLRFVTAAVFSPILAAALGGQILISLKSRSRGRF